MASFPAFALPGGVTPVAALGGVGPTKPDGAETLANPPIAPRESRRRRLGKTRQARHKFGDSVFAVVVGGGCNPA